MKKRIYGKQEQLHNSTRRFRHPTLCCQPQSHPPPRPLNSFLCFVFLARCSRALRSAGVVKGDRVAGVMVNSQEALVCMLSVTAIGAIWR